MAEIKENKINEYSVHIKIKEWYCQYHNLCSSDCFCQCCCVAIM